MKLTKEYVKKCIEEVAPLVEEISGLECDLTDLNLIILPKNELKSITPGVASYRSKNNFSIGNRSLGNEEFTKLILGHELVHNAQDNSFPGFSDLRKSFIINFLRIPLIPNHWLMPQDYLSWAETLRKKFNGNRKDINELYTAPIEELVKIFGE